MKIQMSNSVSDRYLYIENICKQYLHKSNYTYGTNRELTKKDVDYNLGLFWFESITESLLTNI